MPEFLSLVWVSQYAPDSSTYVPLYVSSLEIPAPFRRGTMHAYTTDSAWWNFAVVGNYAARFYKYAMVPVRALQHELETSLYAGVSDIEAKTLALFDGSALSARVVVELLTQFSTQQGARVSAAWRDLFPTLLAHYRDG